MLKLILSAVIEAVYTFMFLLFPLVVAYRKAKIKEEQEQRKLQRKKELAERERIYYSKFIKSFYESEKSKHKQNIIVKGVLAAEYYKKNSPQY